MDNSGSKNFPSGWGIFNFSPQNLSPHSGVSAWFGSHCNENPNLCPEVGKWGIILTDALEDKGAGHTPNNFRCAKIALAVMRASSPKEYQCLLLMTGTLTYKAETL